MARADILLDMVRAASRGEHVLFRKALEALIAEERAKQHHILADRLSGYLQPDHAKASFSTPQRNGNLPELFYEFSPSRRLQDLFLQEQVRRVCVEIVEEHDRADLLRSHGIEPRHRILLAGPPGNGKTSLAEAIAAEMAIPLVVVRYESVIASYLGETAVRLSRLFDQARTRRCVLFFDEFDVVGKERGDVHETGEIKRVVSSLLLQVDALPSYVVVVTATNHPELLDRAVWRRFQVRLELGPPGHSQIEDWFNHLGATIGQEIGLSPATLADELSGASYSELEDFSLDLRRRFVLSLPDANITTIASNLLKQWKHRFNVNSPEQERRNARTTAANPSRAR